MTSPAPLVPVAVAVGLGIFCERYAPLPAPMLVALLAGCLAGWLLTLRRQTRLAVVLLWCAAGLLGACWHRVSQAWPADAIGHHATVDRTLVKVRGAIAEDVNYHVPRRPELLSGQGTLGYSIFLCELSGLQVNGAWQPVSGTVRVSVEGELPRLGIGDGVEILGSLTALSGPVNPGGINFAQNWLDQHIQATIAVKTVDGIAIHRDSDRWSVAACMAQARSWVRSTLASMLPPREAGIAQALLCGEQTALTPDQFESYLQTGVYHVLAVSGQHLVVLCAFVGFLLRFTGGDLRQRAVWLALLVIGYTLLTGTRPPVVRAAVIVLAWCLALGLRRKVNPLNALSLAWIVVAFLNPCDLANTGCLLSFLAVLMLIQVVSPWHRWLKERQSPLDRLAVELQSPARQLWSSFLGVCKWAVLSSLVVWLATMPLVMQQFHLVSPVAVLLGPLMGFPIMIAMVTGMLLVLLSGVPVLGPVLAHITMWMLQASDGLVNLARSIPYTYGYWPDVPTWWVHGFYLLLLSFALTPLLSRYTKVCLSILLGWLVLILPMTQPDVPNGLRLTVLAVGHGTAVVIETPTGKCLVYDAGSLAGPDVAFRHLSNYLWYRRRMKIDEVFLSHADLDHFNGLPDLVDRFRIGIVRMTPTFAQKRDQGTQATMQHLRKRAVNLTLIRQGVELEEQPLEIEVLHPPAVGPAGTENARSLVLLLNYASKRVLLTGDLEEPGLSQVMELPIAPVDVLISPHHGSRVSNTERFAAWCKPKLVISSETYPRGPKPDPYTPLGATLWRTWIHGGTTVELDAHGIRAKTVVTGREWSR